MIDEMLLDFVFDLLIRAIEDKNGVRVELRDKAVQLSPYQDIKGVDQYITPYVGMDVLIKGRTGRSSVFSIKNWNDDSDCGAFIINWRELSSLKIMSSSDGRFYIELDKLSISIWKK